jgi:hypothetical protein
MRGAVGNVVAITVVMVRSCQELARLDEHFADMLVAVHRRSDGRHVVEIEDVHGRYLSMVRNVED